MSMGRNFAGFLIGVFLPITIFGYMAKGQSHAHEYNADACAGPQLRTTEARNLAVERGYSISPHYDCIDKASYQRVSQASAAPAPVATHVVLQSSALDRNLTLAQARQRYQTKISVHATEGARLPNPPSNLYVRSDYKDASGRPLAAYVSKEPSDGEKHPAIIWLGGDDPNTLGDFWAENSGDPVRAFRSAGVVVMLPTLRGGNNDAGAKEFLY